MDHAKYDRRNYPIVEVREGYGEWVRTYERTVQDEMDLRLLERLRTVDWNAPGAALDLACGTGRIGAWLARRAPGAEIDGIDITPEMLERARAKQVYRTLRLGDITATGLPDAAYGLCLQSLADEHLPDLAPLYREAARLLHPGGAFVLAGFHPQFLMAGIPTHYDRAAGESITIRSYVHLLSDHVKAAHAAGFALREMDEGLIDADWLRKKPKWAAYEGQLISFAFAWTRN